MKNKIVMLQLLSIFLGFQFSLFSMENQGHGNLLLNPLLLKKLIKESVKEEIKKNESSNPLSLFFNKDVFWGMTVGLGTFVGFIVSLRYLGFLTKHDLKQWYDSFLSVNAQAVEQENREFNKGSSIVQNYLQNTQQQTSAIGNRLQIFDQNQNQIKQHQLVSLGKRQLELNNLGDTCNTLLQTNYSELLGFMKNCKNISGIVQLGRQFALLQQQCYLDFENLQTRLSEQNIKFTQDISQFSQQQMTEYQNNIEGLKSIQEILLQLNHPFENTEHQLLELQEKLQLLQNNQELDNQQKEKLKNQIVQQLGGSITSFDHQENQLEKLGNQLQNLSQVQQDTKLQMCNILFLMNGGRQEDWPSLLQEFTNPVGPSRPLLDFFEIKDPKEKQDKQENKTLSFSQLILNLGKKFDQTNQPNNLALTYK